MNEFLLRSSLDQILLALDVVHEDPQAAVRLAKIGKSMVDQDLRHKSGGTTPEWDWRTEILLAVPETHEASDRVIQEALERARREAGESG